MLRTITLGVAAATVIAAASATPAAAGTQLRCYLPNGKRAHVVVSTYFKTIAFAQRSIEAFDGVIGFETDEGEGTTFWIRLPLVD